MLYQSAKKLYNTCGVARTFGNTQEVVLARKILFGNYKNKALYIAYVAVLCALTVVCQYFLAQTGNQLLVGSVVNMFLLFATTLCGIVGGATLGCVTPFVAFLLGISKNFAQTPFVAVANLLLCVVYGVGTGLLSTNKRPVVVLNKVVYLVFGALVKFAFMYFVCVKLIFPLFMKEQMLQMLNVAWSWVQLFAALIGGTCVVLVDELLLRKRIRLA